MSNPANDRRAKAAAARSAAVGGDKRRERIIRIVGAATVVIVVIAIIAISIVAKNGSKVPDVTPTADPSAAIPATAFPSTSQYAYGVPFGTGTSKVPVLELWEDFQCPSCEALEKANGAGIRELAAAGKIQLIWRMTTFLDNNLKADLTANGTTASSARATAAWGCAIDQGKTEQYHNTIYANPPATEGKGFTNDQLVSFAKDSGIEGASLDKFTACMDAGTYLPWSANSTVEFYNSGAQGTPYAKLNGVEVPNTTLADQAKLTAAVAAATK